MKNIIAKLRKEKGISQSELAENVEVIRQTITALETYKFYPTLELAYKIAKYFDKRIEEVFIFDEEEEEWVNDNLVVVNEEGILLDLKINYTFKYFTGITAYGNVLLCPGSIFEKPDKEFDWDEF